MNKARRLLVMFITVAAFFLPTSNTAQAAKWIAPAGDYFWGVEGSFCQNGVIGVAVHTFSSDPTFTEPVFLSAHSTTSFQGSDIPQWFNPVPVGNRLGTVDLLIEYQELPLNAVIEEHPEKGNSHLYDIERLTWPLLPVGTMVAVQEGAIQHGVTGAFVGTITKCML